MEVFIVFNFENVIGVFENETSAQKCAKYIEKYDPNAVLEIERYELEV